MRAGSSHPRKSSIRCSAFQHFNRPKLGSRVAKGTWSWVYHPLPPLAAPRSPSLHLSVGGSHSTAAASSSNSAKVAPLRFRLKAGSDAEGGVGGWMGGRSVPDDDKYTHEQIMLMKTQDASYVQLKAQVDGKVRSASCFLSQHRRVRGARSKRNVTCSHALRARFPSPGLQPVLPRTPREFGPSFKPFSVAPVPMAYCYDAPLCHRCLGRAVQKAAKLKSSLHFIGLPAQNKHTVFVADRTAARNFDAAAHFDTDASLLGRTFNRPRTAQLGQVRASPTRTSRG
jgi:hypothetical protein